MAATFVFEYEVNDEIIADAAEAALAATNAGQPPRRLRSLVIAETIVCLQLIAGLIYGIFVGVPGWILVAAGIILGLLALWTGMLAFTLLIYPWNRRRFERIIGDSYRQLDSPTIQWKLSEDGFTVTSRTTQREVPWSGVNKAFVGRTFWILTAQPHGQLLLPAMALPPGAERFLLDRLAQAEAKVQLEQAHPLEPRG